MRSFITCALHQVLLKGSNRGRRDQRQVGTKRKSEIQGPLVGNS